MGTIYDKVKFMWHIYTVFIISLNLQVDCVCGCALDSFSFSETLATCALLEFIWTGFLYIYHLDSRPARVVAL